MAEGQPVRERKLRIRKVAIPVDVDVSTLLLDVDGTLEEDTTPIEWDGSIPEPPKDWMKHNSWSLITSIEDLQDWWARIQLDVGNHFPTIQDILGKTGEVHPKIAFDLETTGLDNRTVNGECKTHVVGVCLAAYLPQGHPYAVIQGPDNAQGEGAEVPLRQAWGIYIPLAHKRWPWNLDKKKVLDLLEDMFSKSIIVTHNGKFDFLSLQGEGDLIAHTAEFCEYTETVFERVTIPFPKYPFLEDTQTLMFMIDSDRATHGGTGLKPLAYDFLKQEMIEFEEITSTGKKKKGSRKFLLKTFDSVEPFLALHYAAADAICTLQLSDVFGYIRERVPLVHQIDTNVVSMSAWLEPQRVLIDREYLLDEDRFLNLKCEHVLKQIHSYIGFPMNPDSPKEVGATLFETLGLPNKGKTAPSKAFPHGQWSTAKENMEELAKEHPEYPIFTLIVEYRELKNAYPKKLFEGSDPEDSTGKFAFNACRTPTGRFACSGGEYTLDGGAGLNVQAIQSLYGATNIQVKAIDTLALQGWRGLASSSMFDPALFDWIKVNVRPVTYVDFPDRDVIKKELLNIAPQLTKDELKSHTNSIIEQILASHREKGLSTLKEKVSSLTFKDNPTVINGHLKLTPDSWTCILNECPHCFIEPEKDGIPCPSYPLEYETTEIMNLRRAFVAPPGWTFFSVDYGAIELRMVTNMANEKLWIEGFNGGKDLHSSMAEAIFKEKFTSAVDEQRGFLRSLSKSITFANLFGGTAHTVQQNLPGSISIEEAEVLYNNWLGAIPGYRKWVETQKEFVTTHLEVFTCTGRIRSLKKRLATRNRRDLGYAERTSLNHPAQGTAADILRIALIRIKDWIEANHLGDYVKIHYHVHDEIDFSCKDEWVPYIVPNLLKIMKVEDVVEQFRWPVGLECDVEYGQSWDIKYNYGKGAIWSGVPGLKMFDQIPFKDLYDNTLKNEGLSVDEYKKGMLADIYAEYRSTGYVDPYKEWASKKMEKFPPLKKILA